MFRRYLLMLALVCSLSAASPAAEPAKRPFVRIAVNSLADLIEKTDKFAAAATAGRKNHIPSGTIPMLAGFLLPVSRDAFESDGLLQILLFSDNDSGTGAIFVAGVEDFDAFLEDVSERVRLEEDTDHGTGYSSLHVGEGLAVADVGDGRAAVFTSVALAEQVADLSWLPDEDGDALVTIESSTLFPELAATVSEITPEELAEGRAELVNALTEARVAETVANGMGDLLVEWLPELGRELARLERVRVLLDFDEDTGDLLSGMYLSGTEDSLPARLAASLEENDNVGAWLLEGLPAGAVSAAVVAPMSAALSSEDAQNLYSIIFERLYPELKNDALRIFGEFYEGIQESAVVGNYVTPDGRSISLSVYLPEDAERMLAATRESIELINRMIDATFDGEDYRFRFVGKPLDGVEGFEEYRIEFTDPARMESMIDRLNREHNLGMSFSMLQDFRLVVGTRSELLKALFVISGQVLPGEAKDLLAKSQSGESTFGDNPRVADMLEYIDDAQAGVMLVNAGEIVSTIARRLALTGQKMAIEEGMPADAYARIFRKAEPEFEGSEEVLGLSSGAVDGELILRGYFPAAAVNAVLADYEVFDHARQTVRDGQEDDDDEDADAYDDDEGEEMDLDGPAEAS